MNPNPPIDIDSLPEMGRLAHQALRRAVRLAHLNGEAHDPDGSGYRYWKAIEDAEKAAEAAAAENPPT